MGKKHTKLIELIGPENFKKTGPSMKVKKLKHYVNSALSMLTEMKGQKKKKTKWSLEIYM